MTIKEKNLDYEIETPTYLSATSPMHKRSKRRISITRLKQSCRGTSSRAGGRSKRRISITRLKRQLLALRFAPCLKPIKEKNLDYEIETTHLSFPCSLTNLPIKEKNLDYEIETFFVPRRHRSSMNDQREESRLRD